MLSALAPPAQDVLAELLADRVQRITGRRQVELDRLSADTTVLVLLRSFDLADLVQGARSFAATLARTAAEPAAAWLQSWTRTRFLFGNPANLTASNPAGQVAPAGSAAWLGPFPEAHQPGLSRLLKPVTGQLPELPAELELPGTGPRRRLLVAVAGLTLVDYLVHLHHTLTEAVLFGQLGADEQLRLSHRPVIGAGDAEGPAAYARVLPEPGDAGRLRLHTWLSGPDPAAGH